MADKKYIALYLSYLDIVEPLTYAERGRLLTAILQYGRDGRTEELSGNERFVFPAIRSQIDRDAEAYTQRCEKNKANIHKRWDAEEYDGIRTYTKDTKEKKKEKEKEKNSIGAQRRHIPPTLEEVRAYCLERKNGIDAEHFIDFYSANGWKQGKGKPIVDWKAAVRTWERNKDNSGKSDPKTIDEVYRRL